MKVPDASWVWMDSVAYIASVAFEVLGLWTLTSVLVAVPVSALFRAQARREVRWRQAERRRIWLDAAN